MTLRLMIVDDNPGFLVAARDLLQGEGLDVVAVASNSAEALRRAAELQPDVTLVDLDLGDESGFELARQLTVATAQTGSPVILISAYREQDLGDLVEASPALGFVSKSRLSAKAIRSLVGNADDPTTRTS
jgi:DNA-binding NarL/FixJ family response regulator